MIVSTKQPYQLVYSIYEHQFLGLLFETFVVQLNEMGEYTFSYQNVSHKNIAEFDAELDETDLELVEFIDRMQQDAVFKKYNKKKISTADFFLKIYDENKGDKLLTQQIEAYIEKYRVQVLKRLRGRRVFIMGNDGYPVAQPVEIVEEPAKVYFHFDRQEKETYYYPIVKCGSERIKFQFKNALILSQSPAYLLVDNKLYAFENHVDANKLRPFLKRGNIVISRAIEETYFKKFVAPLVAQFNVYAKGFTILPLRTPGRPSLHFSEVKNPEDGTDEVIFELYFTHENQAFHYEDSAANAYVSVDYQADNWTFQKYFRDRTTEENTLSFLRKTNLEMGSGTRRLSKAEAFSWMHQYLPQLHELGIELAQSPGSEKQYFVGYSSLEIRIEETNDWFDIKAKVRFGDYEIPFMELRKYILTRQTEFTLPNGQTAVIPAEWFVRYAELLHFIVEEDNEQFSLRKYHLPLIQDLGENGLAQTIISRKLEQLSTFSQLEETPLPKGFKGTLRPYQKAGYDWIHFLKKYNFGGCLADDMGLGKTVMTLAFLQSQKESNELTNPALLVMPTSLIYNWQKEAERFTPDLKLFIHGGTFREKSAEHFADYDLILMSYGILRMDIDFIKPFRFSYAILDESQAIKNPSSNISVAVRELNTAHRLILTGTPLENSTLDIWSQLSFINPGLLGSQAFFRNNYQLPIEKKHDPDAIRKLYGKIKPFMLRRQKSQVATELPEKIEQVFYSDMSHEQAKIYEETKSYYRNLLLEHIEQKGLGKSQLMVLQGLTRLRQLANHPRMVDADYEQSSGKTEDILYQLENAVENGHKVLIFSQYVKHLAIFRQHLDDRKLDYCYLDGSTKKRQEEVERFQNDDSVKIFLISLKAGGVGLNLTAAEYVFILDPWWNPAIEAQAVDRAHRIGQQNTVFTYKFITRNTVEEKILSLQRSKKQLFNELITTEDTFVKSLTKDDILELLS